MARQRKMTPERKAFINSLLEHYKPQDTQDVQDMLKDLLGDTLQGMLEAEMDEKLGYSKYDYQNKDTDDSRNGYSKKTVTSSLGPIDLDIPRDRKGEFEPQIVKKNQTDISNIEDQVLSMYAKGMTTRDISTHLREVYGVDPSAEMITHMTDRLLPGAADWQNRPVEREWPYRLWRCHPCSIPAGRNSTLHCPSDSLFHEVHLIQRPETIYGRSEKSVQSGYRGVGCRCPG